MPITNRDLAPGMVFVATYKGLTHRLEAIEGDNALAFRLDDGAVFNSLSTAGKQVMNGIACNGWRFWTPEDEASEPKARKAKAEVETDGEAPAKRTRKAKAETTETEGEAKPKRRKASGPRMFKNIRPLDDQSGASEGMIRYWCSTCQDGFESESKNPESCPQGHPAVVADDLAPEGIAVPAE